MALKRLVKFRMLAMSRDLVNKGCRGCRYYLHTSSECLKENFRGDYMKLGLIGECGLFKPIQKQASDERNAQDDFEPNI